MMKLYARVCGMGKAAEWSQSDESNCAMCVNMLNICQGCQLLYTIIHIVAQRYCPPASALLDSMFVVSDSTI